MSWMQYLAVSRSFSSIDDRPTRFRMRQEHLLPKFGEDNEWAGAAISTTTTRDDATTGEPARSREKGSTMENGTTTMPTQATTPKHAYPGGRWRIWRSPVTNQKSDPDAPKLVQSELRLDTVKVVRNDLTDSDLLLVPLRKSAETASRFTKQDNPKAADKCWWSRVRGFLAGFD